MNKRDRFIRTIERKSVDYPASWLGQPTPQAEKGLFEYFNVSSIRELCIKLNTDVIAIDLPYHSEVSDAIYAAFNFSKEKHDDKFDRTLTEEGFFADKDELASVDDFDWPDPEKYIDPKECFEIVSKAPEDMARLGVVWSAHFQDACAAFGMENAFCNMIINPEMYMAVSEKIEDFYLKANEIFYESTKGYLDAVLIGNDLGSQNGLMISEEMIRRFVLPGTKKFVQQAKSYGLKVIHHSCGAISSIIPDLIEIGVDVIHPIQALAKGMEPNLLKRNFGKDISFCGGVDAQHLLVNGSPEDVKRKVEELKTIFPTGLIISPSHEAILEDIPPQNVEALFGGVR